MPRLSTAFFPPWPKNCKMEIRALSVKQLNFYVKSLLEGDVRLQSVAVTGELSNFKNHFASGHLYFTLKDADAAIRGVMFRSYAAHLSFRPKDGDQVVLIGRVSLYEKDGQYQFYAEQMLPAGAGVLAARFEQVKAKLEAEGLFRQERKRPLVKFPKRIAVITSDTGAAIRDVLNILGRRWPLAEILLCPVTVQGEQAVPEMIAMLDRVYALGGVDVIILGRGGGSAEDLAAFNDENLARKIVASPIPTVSAVGHETDFSISDFVADLRAPTPSAAAELAAPDRAELSAQLRTAESTMKNLLVSRLRYSAARLDHLLDSLPLRDPESALIASRLQTLDRAEERAVNALRQTVSAKETRFFALAAQLDALSPLKMLTRGYAATTKDGKIITSAAQLQPGDRVRLQYRDGDAICAVEERKIKA